MNHNCDKAVPVVSCSRAVNPSENPTLFRGKENCSMSDSFVGTLTGQDYSNHTTVSIHAGSPQPGSPQPVPPAGPATVTIGIDGVAGQISAGGANKDGSFHLVNAGGKVVVIFEANPSVIRLYAPAGATNLLNTLRAELQGDTDASLTLNNAM